MKLGTKSQIFGIAEKIFKVMGSKVKVTDTFAGGGITINGSPTNTILFLIWKNSKRLTVNNDFSLLWQYRYVDF